MLIIFSINLYSSSVPVNKILYPSIFYITSFQLSTVPFFVLF
ncbi:hypothetical protein HKBW3S42_02007, partial [Candidatus Hakubella thermalkaliphila]